MQHDEVLRRHLVELLVGGHAHVTFDRAVADLPEALRARTIPGFPHSPWSLLEHLRIAQWDILEFSRSASHVSPQWPAGYWPASPTPSSDAAWHASIEAWRRDLKAMCDLVSHPETDLFTPVAWGDGQTVLREAMLVADHNAYHLGQLLTVRRSLGAWSE